MNVLLLSHKFHPDVGGIETITKDLAYSFIESGHNVRVMTWSLDDKQKLFPYSVIRNPSVRTIFAQHAWADIVFENNPCLRLAWPVLFFNRPSIVGLQTWLTRVNGKTGFLDFIKKLWLKRSDHVIACSEAIRKGCWPTALVIENPYQDAIFTKRSTVKRTKNFVFLGRLVSDKGADLAIKAFSKFINSTSNYSATDFSLTLIGEGPERKYLEQLVSDLDLTKRIIFQGALQGDDLVDSLNRHSFILVTSKWEEPFGIVVLEGMACGCIPIVANGGGLPDAVGTAGLTFSRGNIDSLVHCMENLLNDSVLQERLQAAAISHLLGHRQAIVAEKYLNVFKCALDRTR